MFEQKSLDKIDGDYFNNPRMYVHKVVPFVSGNNVYYEIVLTPAYDTTSKFDRSWT